VALTLAEGVGVSQIENSWIIALIICGGVESICRWDSI
jgi:hypothetical protein